jgi:hypothetical protein
MCVGIGKTKLEIVREMAGKGQSLSKCNQTTRFDSVDGVTGLAVTMVGALCCSFESLVAPSLPTDLIMYRQTSC